MEKRALYRFLGYFMIVLVVIVTIRYIIKLPVIIKVLALAVNACLLYTSPSPRDSGQSRMPSSA